MKGMARDGVLTRVEKGRYVVAGTIEWADDRAVMGLLGDRGRVQGLSYALTSGIMDESGPIDISKDNFTMLKLSQKHLISVLSIEETFDLLLENYAEFERDFLGLGLRLSLFGKHGEPLGPRREMNRRLANLLVERSSLPRPSSPRSRLHLWQKLEADRRLHAVPQNQV